MTTVKTKESTSTLNQHSGSILHSISLKKTTQGFPLINIRLKHGGENKVNKIHYKHSSAFFGYLYFMDLINTYKISDVFH